MNETMHVHDDSDMKIVGQSQPAPSWEDEVQKTLNDMKNIREKGLLLQAQQVGSHMAAFVASLNAEQVDPSLTSHRIWLSVFAVTVACESCVHNANAARAVLNAFHDRFRELCPDAYEDSGYSISMSFYYLAVRSVGDSHNEIGRTFAMLCGDESNQQLRQMGRDTFDRCLACMDALSQPLNQEV